MRSRLFAVAAAALLAAGSNAVAEPSQAPGVRRMTLEEALQRAASRHPSALVADQEIQRAEALVREVRAPSLPNVSAGAVATRIDDERKLGDRVIQGAQSLSVNATVSLPIAAPQRWVQWSHARENADVARLSAADVRRVLAVAVARSYLAVIAQHRVIDVSERAHATARAHYEFARGRFSGGVGNRLDEVRAEQEVSTTLAQLELARSGLVRVQEALGVLVAEDGPVDSAEEVSLPEPPHLDEALRDVAGTRGDLRVAGARRNAAERVAHDSWVDFLPTLTGQVQGYYQNPATLTLPETGWQAQLILAVPLYDGGFRYGQRKEREALAAESKVQLEGALRQASAEVRTAFETMLRAQAASDAAQRAAELARKTLELANQAYRAGATTNLEVIDAERRARDAETSAVVAEDGARQARLELLAASGRFP